MYNNEEILKAINITEKFIEFLNELYKDGTINYQQYETMTLSKKELLNNIKQHNKQ